MQYASKLCQGYVHETEPTVYPRQICEYRHTLKIQLL